MCIHIYGWLNIKLFYKLIPALLPTANESRFLTDKELTLCTYDSGDVVTSEIEFSERVHAVKVAHVTNGIAC